MVIPVGVFDYHLDILVDLLGGTQDYVHGGVIHQFQTVIGPCTVALGLYAVVTFAIGKEEVVKYDLIKQTGGEFNDFLGLGTLLGVLVAESLEVVGLTDGLGHTSGNLNAAVLEELDDTFHVIGLDDVKVTMSLQIDLVNLHL